METGSYNELKDVEARAKRVRFVTFLITSVTILLCLLLGIGIWILVGANQNVGIPIDEGNNIVEEVVIVETIEPQQASKLLQQKAPKPQQQPSEIDFKEGSSMLEEVQDSIKQEEGEAMPRQPFRPEDNPFIRTLVELSNNVASELFSKFNENGRFAKIFGQSAEEEDDATDDEGHSRKRRSIAGAIGANALKYLNYMTFGKFMFNEVYSMTEYAVEGRKMSGDPDTFFLDNGFWPSSEKKVNKKAEEKADNAGTTSVDVAKPNRPASAYDDGWTPMVNKVSLKFITDMLTTLLNLMREYLMRDNVMECLWFMFCKDMNHQAKYTDPMGYLARVNSVGLKVLVDREGRETDTVTGVWQALTKWEALNCDVMFPKCDGSKALEIVNEVANAARRR